MEDKESDDDGSVRSSDFYSVRNADIELEFDESDDSEYTVDTIEADAERNKMRRNTSCIVDNNMPAPNRNIIVSLQKLITFLSDNFCCRSCKKGFRGGTDWEFKVETFGFANCLHYRCTCLASASVLPDLLVGSKYKTRDIPAGKAFTNRVNMGDFEINSRMLLGLQLGGSGRKEAQIIVGMLNLNLSNMSR